MIATGRHDHTLVHERLPELATYVAPTCTPGPTIGDRIAVVWREITRTPARSVLATLDGVALAGVGLALRTVTVQASDAVGPFTAKCGADVFVVGHSNPVVEQSCRAAYSGHSTVLFVAAAIALVTSALLGVAVVISRRPDATLVPFLAARARDAVATPARACLTTLTALALSVGAAALRTVPVHTEDELGALTAHCGLGSYLFGSENTVVRDACRDAFSGHARVLVAAVAGALAGAVALVITLARASARSGRPASVPDRTATSGGPLVDA